MSKQDSRWKFQTDCLADLKITGTSVAGISTCFAIPELKICFDVAQGLPFATTMKHYLITHGHMDHAAGIPYIISQKALTSQLPGNFYMPKSMIEHMETILKAWQKLEGHEYQYNFHATEHDKYYEINNEFGFKIFPTIHRIPSNGYTLFRRHKKLKPEFHGKPKNELIAARKAGQSIDEIHYEALISFTGDTKIDFLDQAPSVKDSKILMVEVTYIDDKKSVQSAREWGHIHLDELIPRLPELNCEKVVIKHLSSRYSIKDALKELDRKVPDEYRQKICVFGESREN